METARDTGTTWTNQDNHEYYENISCQTLEDNISKSGLENNDDLNLIFPFLESAQTILEVGAGYGRVIEFLVSKNCQARITAIEKSSHYIKALQEKYSNLITLYAGDLKDFHTSQKFDVILWLWCGIIDFNKDEQRALVEKLSAFLSPQGLFFLDSVFHQEHLNCSQSYIMQKNNHPIFRHLSCEKNILDNAHHAGLTLYRSMCYKQIASDPAINRVMFIFQNKTSR